MIKYTVPPSSTKANTDFPKKPLLLCPWAGRWALGTAGEQPEDICHGWAAGCLGPGHIGLLLPVTLRSTERFGLALQFLQAVGWWAVAPTHRSLEGCTCLSLHLVHSWWVAETAVAHVTQHLFPAPPAWGCVWLCCGYLASQQRPVPRSCSVQRSGPGAVFPPLCLVIFILGVGNAFLQETHLLINPCSHMARLLHCSAGCCCF